MSKKILISFMIILLIMTFISSNFLKAYALDENSDVMSFKKGDKFKLVKNAYKYITTDPVLDLGGGIGNNNFKRDPNYKDYYFKKGEIVTYTGKCDTQGWDGTYYMEVESDDGRKGYVHYANIELAEETQEQIARPSSLSAFISKYKVSSIKTQKNIYDKAYEVAGDEYKTTVQNAIEDVDYIRSNLTDPYEKKKLLEEKYAEIKDETNGIKRVQGDVAFLGAGYIYSWFYQIYVIIDENLDKPLSELSDDELKAKGEEILKKKDEAKESRDDAPYRAYSELLDMIMTEMENRGMERELGGKSFEDIANDTVEDIKDSEEEAETNQQIYFAPGKQEGALANGLEDMMNDADNFVNKDSPQGAIELNMDSLQSFSGRFYNILLTIASALTIIVGMIIGIKFMTASVDKKAEVKKMFVPYAIGCIVVFGSFGIWKIIVELLQSL